MSLARISHQGVREQPRSISSDAAAESGASILNGAGGGQEPAERNQISSPGAAHARDKPSATDGGKHPVDQDVQKASGKERANDRRYD